MARNKNLNGGLFSRRPLTPSETSVSAAIGEYLDRRRIYNLRLNSGKARGATGGGFIHLCPAGTPDRFALYRGICLFIEVKALGESPAPEQLECHQVIERAGGRVITAYDVGDVQRELTIIDTFLLAKP